MSPTPSSTSTPPSATPDAHLHRAPPASLGPHAVPPDRLDAIVPHAARLAEAARVIGDALPFYADAADFVAVLESEGA